MNRRLILKLLDNKGIHTVDMFSSNGEETFHYRRERVDLENTARLQIHPMFDQVKAEIPTFL
ncbi:hypothetical protein AruPA_17980 [Acidiphilium sp. PA]|uniref:hypothetical protein n=1 Tax=Acidiphilium sp. PA TaxID=2871705 RepID=UPI0022434A79|nr:hypothetical protein [Acidiphilium sp. PA]MCW8308925.1 hypothetical protein [Acidiphilium sp. PA]